MEAIAAIATAPSIGGIGIIRISGKNSFNVIKKIFKPKNPEEIKNIKGFSIKFGHIINPITEEIIDEVLVSYFKEPHSYTTENMCEISCHGGNVVMQKVLELCLKNGAKLAEAGEFTKRAFLNGRIDLVQAESVVDIINAKTEKETNAAIKQLEGFLSQKIREIKQDVLDIMVKIEVAIDYPEYNEAEIISQNILNSLKNIKEKLTKLDKSFDTGKIIKEGIKTAIIGRPNVGKSSLLNAILKEERAIVTEFAGTTRDTIEELISIRGIPIKIIDTAGIRNAENEVEKMGINKAKEIVTQADLIIAVFDSSEDLSEEDNAILNLIKDKNAIIVLNKKDLKIKTHEDAPEFKIINKPAHIISATQKTGIDALEDEIVKIFKLSEIGIDSAELITNIRHKDLVNKAIQELDKAKEAIHNNMPIDIISINIKEILEYLGKITGESVSEDIINEIFSKFCLGK